MFDLVMICALVVSFFFVVAEAYYERKLPLHMFKFFAVILIANLIFFLR